MNARSWRDLPVPRWASPARRRSARELDIAERLGFAQTFDIRKLVKRNDLELRRYGVLATMAKTPAKGSVGGRPTEEYWLNEPQALLIAMRSDAELAPAVREMLIRVFMAWRRGQLGGVNPEMIAGLIDATRANAEALRDLGAAMKAQSDEVRDMKRRLDEADAARAVEREQIEDSYRL